MKMQTSKQTSDVEQSLWFIHELKLKWIILICLRKKQQLTLQPDNKQFTSYHILGRLIGWQKILKINRHNLLCKIWIKNKGKDDSWAISYNMSRTHNVTMQNRQQNKIWLETYWVTHRNYFACRAEFCSENKCRPTCRTEANLTALKFCFLNIPYSAIF